MTQEQLSFAGMAVAAVLYVFFMLKHKMDQDKEDKIQCKKRVARKLSRLGKEYHVYNDFCYESDRGKTLVDHVVTSPYGIFVIDTCSYSGKLYGSATSQQWTQQIMGVQNEKKNPIRENMHHIRDMIVLSPDTPNKSFISMVALPARTKSYIYAGDEHHITAYKNVAKTICQHKRVLLTEEQLASFEKNMKGHWEKAPSNTWKSIPHKKTEEKVEGHEDFGYCPICGGNLVRRSNAHGLFFGCSNYPSCSFNTK